MELKHEIFYRFENEHFEDFVKRINKFTEEKMSDGFSVNIFYPSEQTSLVYYYVKI